ncbi:MAG: hypothetical protein ABIF09_03545, partial [Gemmatimonadota bacterium]
MYSRCLVCRAPFQEVRILEHLPFGNRVAYDLHRGRLWVVCRSCRRWSLVPLESRWEALEELERLVSKEVRLLSKTDNIALFRVGPLEIVKVGQANLAEEAWWRYGRQLPDRGWMSRWTPPLLRRVRFGDVAWVGRRNCAECGFLFEDLTFNDRKILLVRPGEELGGASSTDRASGANAPGVASSASLAASSSGAFSLTRRCPKCRSAEEGGLRLTGIEAELTLARVLAFQSDMGESRVTVQAAARL